MRVRWGMGIYCWGGGEGLQDEWCRMAKKKECTGKCFHMFDRAESMRKEGVR